MSARAWFLFALVSVVWGTPYFFIKITVDAGVHPTVIVFARIERWSRIGSRGDVHWRSISKDNVLTIYGLDSNSRIADPLDTSRIFSWLIAETRDDKGNGVVYRYEKEDGALVELKRASERNRGALDDVRRSANRYLKRIQYGNRTSLLDDAGQRPRFLAGEQVDGAGWMFEVVFDYGEHSQGNPRPGDAGTWHYRPDAFSSYRAGFEVRTTRLCRRVLMFHHFAGQAEIGSDCLVRSTDFEYSNLGADPAKVAVPVYAQLRSVIHSGYRREGGAYRMRSLPAVEFGYSKPVVQQSLQYVDWHDLENLPIGLDGSAYRWVDLHGEGIPGVLAEQAGAWFYKRNLSPLPPEPGANGPGSVRFAPLEVVAQKPAATLAAAQILDLAGDGQPDVVTLDGASTGLYEHDEREGWHPFRDFVSRLQRDFRDPNLRFVDLDGDGRADVLITEEAAMVWHPSLGEEGFGPALRVTQLLDEELNPRAVFADGTQSIYLADLSGDGLTDLVRIRNGEVCYWPNLGYGRFGAKVTMDNAPWFDGANEFDQKRIRLADIDGSGTTDIIYLHRDGARVYFNQSGNAWSEPQTVSAFPPIDDAANILPVDLLGNGTTCLVWSSPAPGLARPPLRYVNLAGAEKPHLLIGVRNNLGTATSIGYAPSTKFYLQDKRDGRPWITRLPFPVHVVEKVTTFDDIAKNRFVTRYTYHHGYFDGEEREFRGFAMVEQWDSEVLDALDGAGAANIAPESHVPPVHTRTWFHTGLYLGRERVSRQFEDEYFREPGLGGEAARDLLLDDTILPSGLTLEEEREACRALKGSMLRRETYADDAGPGATAEQSERARMPYSVAEQSFTIRTLQFRGSNHHGVFLVHPREAITYHYERNPADPRIQHSLTLEVDNFGNVLKQAAIGYGRRTQIREVDLHGQVQLVANPGLEDLDIADRDRQTTPLLTYTESRVTNSVQSADTYLSPLPCETRTFELTNYVATGLAGRFQATDLVEMDPDVEGRLRHKFAAPEVPYEARASGNQRRRPIECLRTLYRSDDLSKLLPLGQLQSRAIAGESYKLAFTPGLLTQVFKRPAAGQAAENLLLNAATVLGGQGGNQGGYVQSQALKGDGRFPASDSDDHWWIPGGRTFFTSKAGDDAGTELAEALEDFFLARRYRDPFGQDAFVDFDDDRLMMIETRDVLGNRMTVETNDYRVLQPRVVSDPNRNRTAVAFDTLGLVVGTALMGKPQPAKAEGDSLDDFEPDLSRDQIDDFLKKPRQPAANPKESEATDIVHQLLKSATTRIVYDLHRYSREGKPAFAATIARETHISDVAQGPRSKLQVALSYSDGFGREIQKKVQAEPGPLDVDDQQSPVVNPRWVARGWTIFNNKGKPVRQYEPFFSATHEFEFGVTAGFSPVLFYDPAERVIATLHPNHTFEKVVFDPWQQTTYDVNDTCALRAAMTGDPRTDTHIRGYVSAYFAAQPPGWLTWHAQRIGGSLGSDEQAAAIRAAAHADSPTTVHFDTLGRLFVTVARNRVSCAGHDLDGTEENVVTRVELDIEGNQREVRDERRLPVNHLPSGAVEQRAVMRYDYDMLGNRVHQLSMEAGARWMLNDVTGKPIRVWDSRGHNFSTSYDALRRVVERNVFGTREESDPRTRTRDVLVERVEYGEPPPGASQAEEEKVRKLNLRTRIYRHFDSAGVVINARVNDVGEPLEAYDFKGNPVGNTRRLVKDYSGIADWRVGAELEDERFEGRVRYDALNRAVQSIAPHSNLARAKRNVIQPVFNEANLLERVDVWLEHANEPAALLDVNAEAPSAAGVGNIDYDAKGQRLRIDYKNGTSTTHRYDPHTWRLVELLSRRNPDALQNLQYTYDPAGNITRIRDDAQQTIYFRNQRVEPSNDYVYDATYRLIQATGREHLGQLATGDRRPPTAPDAFNTFHIRQDQPNVAKAMGTYIERYVYDAVGNFLQMQHRGSDPGHAGWTRAYDYRERSLIEDGANGAPVRNSNRLSSTTLNPNGANAALTEPYQHDVHGNMVRMPHLSGLPGPNMHWDHRNQLRRVDLGGGGTAFYVYDAAGQRLRKIVAKSPGLTEERIYLGAFEIYREHAGGIATDSATLERETLHVMDGKQRIVLVETRSAELRGDDQAPRQMIRYQLGNHLGSSTLELDQASQIISHEEYSPYGSSTYQAVRSQTETPKRYRYTGKERDKESGFSYHGARYYAPWIGKWSSCDPAGPVDGVNYYRYVSGNPIRLKDASGLAGDEISSEPTPLETAANASSVENHVAGPPQAEVGPYSKKGPAGETPVRGDHIHQVASRTQRPGAPRKSASQFSEALAVRTKGNPGYNDPAGQRVESSYNRASWGEDMQCRPADVTNAEGEVVREGVVTLESTGETTVGVSRPATPSNWSENQKSRVKLREAGKTEAEAVDLVLRSDAQLASAGATPLRVPDAPRDTPKSLQEGQRLSSEMPLSEVSSQLPPEPGILESPGFRQGVSATGQVLQGAGKALTIYAAAKSGERVINAVERDIRQGTAGEQTARTIAHEAGGWAGALAVGGEGAALGLLCGPFAEICSPLGGLVFGIAGYYGGSGSVDSILYFATGR